MRDIQVSTDVFARIWSLRQKGEDTEDAILRRVLSGKGREMKAGQPNAPEASAGLQDQRFGVTFPEGFQIERVYLGRMYRAHVENGQWVINGIAGRYSKLNELSRAIGTKTENAWSKWFFFNERGQRRPVSELRNPETIASRGGASARRGGDQMVSTRVSSAVRWCDDVRSALAALGGKAPLSQIYREVRRIRKSAGRSTPTSLEEVVRKELEMRSSDSDAFCGEDWFEMAEGKGSGIWALRVA